MNWSLEIHHIALPHAGDSTLIVVRGDEAGPPQTLKRAVLVDGGQGEPAANIIDAYLQAKGIVKVDVIVVTHYDKDHVGGISSLLFDAEKYDTARYRTAILYDQGEPIAKDKFGEDKHGIIRYLAAVDVATKQVPKGAARGVLRATKWVNSFDVSCYDVNGVARIPFPLTRYEGKPYLRPHWLLGKDVMWGNGSDEMEGRPAWAEDEVQHPGAPTMVCIAANKYVLQPAPATLPNLVSSVYVNPRELELVFEDENIKRDPNNHKSLGFVVQFNNFRYYIAGDLTSIQEDGHTNTPGTFQTGVKHYLNPDDNVQGRVLIIKASHHGSADSTSGPFLRQLRPSMVVISNPPGGLYGHPSNTLNNILDGYPAFPIYPNVEGFHPNQPPPPPNRFIYNYMTNWASWQDGKLTHIGGKKSIVAGDPRMNNPQAPGHIVVTVSEDQSRRSPEGQIYRGILAAATAVNNIAPTEAADLVAIADKGTIYGTAAAVALAVGGTLDMVKSALDAVAYVGTDDKDQSVVANADSAAVGENPDSLKVATAAKTLTRVDGSGKKIARVEEVGLGIAEAMGIALTGGTDKEIEDAAVKASAHPVGAAAAGLAAVAVRDFQAPSGAIELDVVASVVAAAIKAASADATKAQAAVIAAAIGATLSALRPDETAQLTTKVARSAGLHPGQAALAGAVAGAAYHEGTIDVVNLATKAALQAAGFSNTARKAAGNAVNLATLNPASLFNVQFLRILEIEGPPGVEPIDWSHDS